METNELQVSRNIKSCRERYGLTQEDVSKQMGITKQTYIKIENSPLQCSIQKLNEVASAIGCNINDFFIPNSFTFSE